MKRVFVIYVLFLLLFIRASAQNLAIIRELESHYDKVYCCMRNDSVEAYTIYRYGKVGWSDALGKEVVMPKYDRLWVVQDAYPLSFIVMLDNKQGVCDINGIELIKPSYDSVYYHLKKTDKKQLFYFIKKADKTGVCLDDGKEIVAPMYERITNLTSCRDLFFSIKNEGKWGILDGLGKAIIPSNRFDSFEYFVDSEKRPIFIMELNGKFGTYDYQGHEIIPPIYDVIRYAHEFRCTKNGKTGVFSIEDGSEILPVKYDSVIITNDYKYIRAYTEGRSGIFRHSDGKEIIPRNAYQYKQYFPQVNGFVVWDNSESKGLCDSVGNLIVPLQYYQIAHDRGFVYAFSKSKDQKIPDAVFSMDGGTIIEKGRYNMVATSSKHYPYFLVAMTDEMVGICDSNGKEIIPPKYVTINKTEDEESTIRFIVGKRSTEGKPLWGLIDDKGVTLIENKYNTVNTTLREGLWGVGKIGKMGYVSLKDGREVVPLQYDSVFPFLNGIAKVYKDGKVSLLSNPLNGVVMDASQGKTKTKAVSTYPAPDSDVDKDIPTGKKADNNTHAFIIANENYPVAKVPYALNDGWMFEQYCKKTLGIKEENVHLYEDATGGNIMACVEEMKQTTQAANGQATIIFYYAGHAFPDEEKSTAYLLPIDGDSKNPSTGYSLENLYKEMNKVQVKQMVCFLDACFSGATRDDQMLITGRGVTIKVKDEIPQGNMVVMTSATGAETAHSYEEMHHGLFTYFLLQKLQETKGDVTLGDLSEYVTKMVKRKSVLINQKKQTPTVIPSPKLQGTWQEMKL